MVKVMLTSNIKSLFLPLLVTSTIGGMAQLSIFRGFDKKSDWKKDFKMNEDADVRREVMATMEETAGKPGRPRLQRETHDIENYLLGDKPAVKQEISSILAEMEYDYDLAFLKEALIQSNHLEDIPFSTFYHAICELTEKDYKYDRAQRMDTQIKFYSDEFKTSKKPRMMRGRKLVRYWTKRFSSIH